MSPLNRARVMCIGRSDCVGGAGVQADVKAVTALGGYATTVITTVNAGDSNATYDIVELPPTIIVRQIERITREIGTDAIKIGRLFSEEQIDIVANVLEREVGPVPLVMAPILMAQAGGPRLTIRSIAALKRRFAHVTTVLSVSREEAEQLTGMDIQDPDTLEHAALMLLTLGCQSVLIHGAWFESESVSDILATSDGVKRYDDMPSEVTAIYGAKTTLAAAVATGLAQGLDIVAAVERSRRFLMRAVIEGVSFMEPAPVRPPGAAALAKTPVL